MLVRVLALGAVLGVVSRLEEVTPGFDAGISSDGLWLAAAFAAGVWRGPLAGAAALTAANLAYYAFIGATEPGVRLASVAGRPAHWFLLGIAGGAVCGAAGALWARWGAPARIATAVLLMGLLLSGAATDLRQALWPLLP
jgi:hypothetical protein